MRKKMIEILRKKGIRNERLLEIMGRVPRHWFLDPAFSDWAYKDQAFPIGNDQTISQPFTVAFQTLLIAPQVGQRILEIGTGSGYQAVILHEMGAKVYTIERQEFLFQRTTKLLNKLGYGQIRTFYGDGFIGLERMAPFDGVLITAGATELPMQLITQLGTRGRMVVPLGKGDTQIMTRYIKNSEGRLAKESFGTFKFVPMLPDINPETD